jgi:dolichol-phosphate mannosyltransferase
MAEAWQPPRYEAQEFFPRRTRYSLVIVALNEGERLRGQLRRLYPYTDAADVLLADGRSNDGSTDADFLRAAGVRALLVTDEGGLSTATRMGLAYSLVQGYAGVVTMDGNGKDGVEALPRFLEALNQGYDLVQGSRFLAGGVHANTPPDRYLGIRLVLAPLLGLGCGYWYTDPTNAFRALSTRFLNDPRVQPMRRLFVHFSLQHYLLYRAAALGFRVQEIPVRRVYPKDGPLPTKIHGWRTKARILREMLEAVLGKYNPDPEAGNPSRKRIRGVPGEKGEVIACSLCAARRSW